MRALTLLFLFWLGPPAPSFWQQQLRYPRVRAAYARCWPGLQHQLAQHHLDTARLEIILRLLKTQRTLEVWARNQGTATFERLCEFPLAATSGKLGPKRRAGDGQVPEGRYYVDRFNPSSRFHLSLGLDYPTPAERQAAAPADPGGDIFIHGSNVTVGCLPLTDTGIEPLYLLAVAARSAGQTQIPVYIFPFPLTEQELAAHAASPHQAFWRSLQPAYAELERQLR